MHYLRRSTNCLAKERDTMTDTTRAPFEDYDRVEIVEGSYGIGTVTSCYYDSSLATQGWWCDVAWDNDPATAIYQDVVPAKELHHAA